MRIAIDLSPAVHQKAGLGRYARTLAEHLVTQDAANEYVAFAYGEISDEGLSRSLRDLPRANVRWNARPWRMGVLLAHQMHISMDRALPRVDVFHATEHLLPPLKNCATVFTLHDLIFRLFPEFHLPLNREFLKSAMPYFLGRADAIIAVSEATKRDAIRLYDVPEDKITVIYEGVDPALKPERDPERIGAARAKYAQGCPYMLFVSTIEPRKNIAKLVDAARVLRGRGFPHRLLIAGRKGWLYEGIFEHVRAVGMDGEVDFLDYVPDEDLPALYAGAEVFAFPSLYEGFGLTPLEAMACGTPVVCSNTSSLPEVVGDSAVMVNPHDLGEIVRGIERVLTDAALRDQLRARGPVQASKFSWERAAEETLAVYRQVNKRASRRQRH